MKKFFYFLSLIQFAHTLFALPFAVAVILVNGYAWPDWSVCGMLALALFFARSAAMSFNRYVDAEYDALNRRTASRVLVRGLLVKGEVLGFLALMGVGFVLVSFFLNALSGVLSLFILPALLFYSLWKRFSAFCHLYLGAMIGLSVLACDVALTASVSLKSFLLFCAVWAWVFGFDVLYSLADLAFDKQYGLCSFPVRFGAYRAILCSRVAYSLTLLLFCFLGVLNFYGWVYYLGVLVIAMIFALQHLLVSPEDFSRVHKAFFYCNSCVGFVFLCVVAVESGGF